MEHKQLLPKSDVFKDEIRARVERAENPTKKMAEISKHAQNCSGTTDNDLFQVLDSANPRGFEDAQAV